jgi:hypothetical protein
MTEQNLTEETPQNQNTSLDANTTPQEKVLRQSEVDNIVKGAKLDAYKKGRDEAMAELQKQQQSQPATSQMNSAPQSMGGMQQQTPDDIRRAIQDELTRQSQHYAGTQILNQFISKLEAGKGKYPDFDSKVAQLQLDKIPEIIPLLNSVDNTADVLHDLGENPHKVGILLQSLKDPRTAHLAQAEMARISNSIKANQAAVNQPSVNDPLSQVIPSAIGTDNGSLSVRDYKNQSWLRG